jgi:predicted HicB family RNase H-like nuclease
MARPTRADKKTQRHTLLLRPDTWDWLEQQAKRAGQSVNELIESLIETQRTSSPPEH